MRAKEAIAARRAVHRLPGRLLRRQLAGRAAGLPSGATLARSTTHACSRYDDGLKTCATNHACLVRVMGHAGRQATDTQGRSTPTASTVWVPPDGAHGVRT